MSLYRRGDVWWYKFRFANQVIRESSKSESKTVAKDAERSRRRELEESFNRISKPRTAQLFAAAAEAWLHAKTAHLSSRSVIIERANLKHINPYFGKMLFMRHRCRRHRTLSSFTARTGCSTKDCKSGSGNPACDSAKEPPLGGNTARRADAPGARGRWPSHQPR